VDHDSFHFVKVVKVAEGPRGQQGAGLGWGVAGADSENKTPRASSGVESGPQGTIVRSIMMVKNVFEFNYLITTDWFC